MKGLLLTSLLLGGTYFALMPVASNGYGYTGYNGHYRSPSWFYFGGPKMHYGNRSVRSGSIGGTRVRGGGPGSGK